MRGCVCWHNHRSASWEEAMVNGKFAQLTRKHGIKVGAGFLCSVEHGVVEMGLTVNGMFVQVLPLMQPATIITLSNVPPVYTD